ncbi:antichymotrypsin-2-like isoform X1 [Anticarsia gemmatalis]|uniref:antichymotrypsin-2-like isoform X1 n=1 Tax=Anticarsia gemmatalis TaxID=129554 RepID=UPI003F76EF04
MSDSNLQKLLHAGNLQFTAKMFNEVANIDRDKSCVLSAFSVLSPLAQLALASVGDTRDEILSTIGLPKDNVTKEVFLDVNARLRSVKGVELKQANKVYVRDGFTLNHDFAVVSKDVFNSEVQNIDFGNRERAADEINAWVQLHTNNRIKNLVQPSTFNGEIAAILVNAIYFKGNWKKRFNAFSTRELDFYSSEVKKSVIPMMYQRNHFKYGESNGLDAKFLEMQYEGGETSFVVVLPNQYGGIDSLIEELKDPAAFTKGLTTMGTCEVEVTLPKFKIETTTDLKNVLSKMNIKKLFSLYAELNNLIYGEEHLHISDAVQKAFIEVNEEGAEAAAANMFRAGCFPTSIGNNRPELKIFKADHPFVFFLMERDNILFNGVFRA